LTNKKEQHPIDSMKSIQDALIPGNPKVLEGDYKPNFLKDTASSTIPFSTQKSKPPGGGLTLMN